MGIFGNSSSFDQDVEKATSENNTNEEWGLILEICDRAGASAGASRDCLRAVLRRLAHPDPHVALQAAVLLDACISNCGRSFHLEVASREFETEFRRLLSRAQPGVAAKLRELLRKWAEGEFRGDPQLDLIRTLWAKVRLEEADMRKFSGGTSSTAAATAAQREQDELARAIALSLRETGSPAAAPAPLYPRVEAERASPPAARQVRALYDFEAAEDNELTFLAGEIVHVTDSSDPNWWKGYNDRGEGLFPANFVTSDLSEPKSEERTQKSVQWAESAGGGGSGSGAGGPGAAADDEAEVRISEAEMDAALALLHESRPEAGAEDAPALARLERRVGAQGALVDAALERADRRHARLTQLSADLVDALNLYHHLMRDPKPPMMYHAGGMGAPPAPHGAPPAGPPHAGAPPPPAALYFPPAQPQPPR